MTDQITLLRHIEILEEVIKQTKHKELIEDVKDLKNKIVEEFVK